MWCQLVRAAAAGAVLLTGGMAANAADLDYPPDAAYEENGYRHNGDYREDGGHIQPVHDRSGVDHAYRKLRKHGFYEIALERSSIPYSFSACKRGKRYHIHIDYNGELEELNSLGACHQYSNGYDDQPRYYSRHHEKWRNRVYRRARYDDY